MDLRALHTRLLLPVVALALCAASPAIAAWPNSPLVNVPLCATHSGGTYPRSVSDGAGGAIVTWQDYRNGNWDLYAQRVSASGAPRWTANGVALCTAAGTQKYAVAVADGAGGAIVAWADARGGNWRVYTQRISGEGTVQWTADGVALSNTTAIQDIPALAADGAGGAIVTWHDQRNGNYDIYAQRISAAGAVQWTGNGVALCTSAGDQSYPAIAPDGAGGAIVTWEDQRVLGIALYAQRISAGGTPQWTADGVNLCAASTSQWYPAIVADDAGGAIVTWRDNRSGTWNIYAQRVSSGGAVQWAAAGVVLCTAAVYQHAVTAIIPDGAGGAILAWYDYRSDAGDIYAQRISAAGSVQWAANGVGLCTATGEQTSPTLVSDGEAGSGAIVTWYDARLGAGHDVYAQRVSSAGAVRWTADGVALCTATGEQSYPTVTSDGAGGGIVAWSDSRNPGADMYAQRVDQWGQLGAQPTIVNVRDVPNDQGGQVSLFWNSSPLDSFPAYSISDYWIWRQVPSALARAALARGARVLPDGASPQDAPRGVFRTTTLGTTTFYWELVDTQIAQGFPGYSYVAPTTCDSVTGANPRTVFMVEARGALAGQWWFSDPDSGYSVDNLAPAAPSPFTGEYLAGATTLHWGVSGAADFATFRLYRGPDASFVPGPANLVVTKADTGYVDIVGSPCIYKLAAVDVHGNASPCALLQPSGTAGVPRADVSHELALSAPAPNPLRGSCWMRLALPHAAPVSLAIFDQQGRHVRTLLAGALPAGEHPVAWDGRDEGGRPVASALYFVRLETGGRAISRRLVMVR
jgi:hypothetical protein